MPAQSNRISSTGIGNAAESCFLAGERPFGWIMIMGGIAWGYAFSCFPVEERLQYWIEIDTNPLGLYLRRAIVHNICDIATIYL